MNATTFFKQQEIISIRAFIHDLSKITSAPRHKLYTIVKNGKKVGTYIPEKFEDEFFDHLIEYPEEPKKYHSLFANYDKLAFNGPANLSQTMDEILYGKV